MKKLFIYFVMAGVINLASCSDKKFSLLSSTLLPDFPSGSSIEIVDNSIVLIGDDATQILLLDTDYNRTDSITIFPSATGRIPKDEKTDFEASAIVNDRQIVVFGSGSTELRKKALFINLPVSGSDSFPVKDVTALYSSFSNAGIKELNIEGATVVKGQLVLANRANASSTNNQLIIIPADSIDSVISKPSIHVIVLPSSSQVIGLSGLCYLPGEDLLLFTASTELTGNSYDDGAIGDSYIGWLKNAGNAIKNNKITVQSMVNISSAHPTLKGQKIESIAVESVSGKQVIAHLVADNDNGTTTLFKVQFETE